ncbi:unnamed protein product, partial [Mesorhabditis belari]|uniref:7TM GPCR serpentine receptor class x (Srx) domain-containing protein n=1 Tax=Mesorhabditis belari TaxID=2138241 RepID=A0AAF3FGK3_9BILA
MNTTAVTFQQVVILMLLGIIGILGGLFATRVLLRSTIVTGIVRHYFLCIVFFASLVNAIHLIWGVPKAIWSKELNVPFIDYTTGLIAYGAGSFVYMAKTYFSYFVITMCSLLDTFTFLLIRRRRIRTHEFTGQTDQQRLKRDYILITQMLCNNMTVIVAAGGVLTLSLLQNLSNMMLFICWTALWLAGNAMEGFWVILFFREKSRSNSASRMRIVFSTTV